MKIIFGIIGVIVLLLGLGYIQEKTVVTAINEIQTTANDSLLKIQESSAKQQAQMKYDNWAATKTKMYVRARDAKTCMKVLKIDVINNEVAECNKDHYVEVRNDEVEKFKKEQQL